MSDKHTARAIILFISIRRPGAVQLIQQHRDLADVVVVGSNPQLDRLFFSL
jgi:hypothetical protein